MKAPSRFARLSAVPPVTLVLFIAYGALVLCWFEDSVSGWLALAAVGAALRTFSAVGKVRRYKAWAAEWDAMGAPLHAPPQPETPVKRRWALVTIAIVLFVAIPVHEPLIGHVDETTSTALGWLWVAICFYLVWKLFARMRRAFIRRAARSTAQAQAKVEAAPVAWLLGRASSSPSLADAVQNLPEYSARLLSRG